MGSFLDFGQNIGISGKHLGRDGLAVIAVGGEALLAEVAAQVVPGNTSVDHSCKQNCDGRGNTMNQRRKLCGVHNFRSCL